MPSLTASTPISPTTARMQRATKSGGTACTASTPSVFWAVSAVMAVQP
jgi:hypothetical protein